MRVKRDFLQGVRAGAPVLLGFIPVAFAFSIAAEQAGMFASDTVFMSVFVFAGASQIAAATMIRQGAGLAAILLATLIINLRHVIMSTCVMHRMDKTPLFLRLLCAFGVTDESFVLFTAGERAQTSAAYMLGIILISYAGWVAGTAIGCVTTQFLPDLVSNSLGITIYAMFIGLIAPDLAGNRNLVWTVAITAALSYLLRMIMDASWAMIASTLLGALAGVSMPEGRARACI